MSTKTQLPVRFLQKPNELGTVAASSGIGQLKRGVEKGPEFLLQSRLLRLLREKHGLNSFGDTDDTISQLLHSITDYQKSTEERSKLVSEITRNLSQKVYEHAVSGRKVLTIGGDHSIGLGSVSGIARAVHEKYQREKKLGVIWVDAHADINTPETSGSGNMHGMPLAFLAGLCGGMSNSAFEWVRDEHRISLDKLVYIGLRDIDSAEACVIREHNIKVFAPPIILLKGIERVMDEVLEYLGPDTPIHLGFDIDGLDPIYAPCTGLPVQDGLSLDEGVHVCERLRDSGQLVSMDVVEINPVIGSAADREKTLESAIKVVTSALR